MGNLNENGLCFAEFKPLMGKNIYVGKGGLTFSNQRKLGHSLKIDLLIDPFLTSKLNLFL